MIPKKDLDYVELYANKLKNDNSVFRQQKKIIESQLHSSSAIFRKMLGTGKTFKINARTYLTSMRLI